MAKSLIARGDRKAGAVFSRCERYRYELWRTWGRGPHLVFIGLNPSTADERRSDPTVTRCINFARRDGYAGMAMLNIFALRSTDPRALLCESDPVGPANNAAISKWLRRHAGVEAVACWGSHPSAAARCPGILEIVGRGGHRLRCLGVNRNGAPKHPLYLRSDTPLRAFRPELL